GHCKAPPCGWQAGEVAQRRKPALTDIANVGRAGSSFYQKTAASPVWPQSTATASDAHSRIVMDWLRQVIEWGLHLDKHLSQVIADYGGWTYAILATIVFCETGLVVTPFLPGDSLLFAAGTFASGGALDLGTLVVVLLVAAIGGDALNYSIGRYVGP